MKKVGFMQEIKVGFFLATRRTKRTSILTNMLVIFVMVLTFLNLLFVRGILIGLPSGAINANEESYYGDIYISARDDKKFISNTKPLTDYLDKNPYVKAYSVRYITQATVDGENSKYVAKDEKANTVVTSLLGIEIADEIQTTDFKQNIIEGKMFEKNSADEVILGVDLVDKFDISGVRGNEVLSGVDLGSKVDLTIGTKTKEVTVVGFIESKVSETDIRVIGSKRLVRSLVTDADYKPDEIAVKLFDKANISVVQEEMLELGLDKYAEIENPSQYLPSFVVDIVNTFAILGDLIGTIGLFVASITIFIVIFVTAVNNKKFIGILKGIGISPVAVEISYVFQSMFYAMVGSALGLTLLYGILVPYFLENPIKFPFADGVLVANVDETITRTAILFVATIIAGYLPARYIVKQNTLDAILGR